MEVRFALWVLAPVAEVCIRTYPGRRQILPLAEPSDRASISRRLWLVRVADLSILATIRAQTLHSFKSILICRVLLVALPCDSWLERDGNTSHCSCRSSARDAAASNRDDVDATHACNSTSHWTLHPVDVATATPST